MRSDLTVGDLGEKRVLREIVKPLLPAVQDGVGAGDDAAVIPFPAGSRLVFSSDKLPEDLLAVQFGVMTPFEHGRYLVAAAVSDIGAMGAEPLGVLLTLALPNDFRVDYVRELVMGAVAGGAEWDAPVLGGDTGWGTSLCVSCAAVGHLQTHPPLVRSGARDGDLLAVSGPVGGFGAALAYFDAATVGAAPDLPQATIDVLRERLVRPDPRIQLGRTLVETSWCRAAMDITDGLGQSLVELAEASGVGLEIDASAVPIHPVASAVSRAMDIDELELAFGIGLDLELLVAAAPTHADDAARHGLLPFGRARAAPTIEISRAGRTENCLPGRGWEHFGGDARSRIARKRCP